VPFKAKAACRHHIPKQRHRVTNWAEYDAALRARGSLTVWFTPEAIAAWAAPPRTSRGGQPTYSDLAIATALTLKAVFRLALRQTEGLIGSILQLLDLDLTVPDHSTLSRRAATLEVPRPQAGSAPVHLLVDSTGLKFCGPGEWLTEKHGTKRRRAWRVLHLATDTDTGRIVASVLTDKDADDGSQVGPLLDRIEWHPSPATAPTTATMSTPNSRPAIPLRPWSCPRARMQCRARRPVPRRRSGTPIYDVSPSAAAWAGRRPQGTTGALWWRLTSRDGNASSAMGCARKRTGDKRLTWPSRPTC
jgi:hypothetical protein